MIHCDKLYQMASIFDQVLKLLPYQASASEFFFYIADSATNKAKLYQEIRACKMDEHKCRFNLWRLLMGVCSIGATLEEKTEELLAQREGYKVKKAQAYSVVPVIKKQAQPQVTKNPLMKAMVKTPKIEEVSDDFLKDEIRKDVERTYQQLQFFQKQPIIKLLSTILFVWCKRNPEVSYKQGMNEVLASLVYVYFQEALAQGRQPDNIDSLSEEKRNVYVLWNNVEFAEPDIYCVFEKVMNIQNQMYKTETDSNLKGIINPNSKNNTPILQRIITIIDQKLKSLDIELFRVLKLQDVQTKTFLLRWIRCMHTRQFSLDNSFLIWDSIFLDYCESPSSREKCQFEFIDAMCVAMFVYMRSIALTRETAYEIQQTYQKYPNLKKGGYLEELINLAWSLCEALRTPASLNSSDWVGQNNSKTDAKIQIPKSKDMQIANRQQQKQKQQQSLTHTSPKQPHPQQPTPSCQKQTSEQHSSHSATDMNILNFNITLAATEWQQLVQKLQKSLTLNSDEESRKYILEAIHIIKSKVQGVD